MISYRKIGGIHFARVLSFGFTWYFTGKPIVRERTKRTGLHSVRLASGARVARRLKLPYIPLDKMS